MAKITESRMQEVRNAFRVLGSLTDEELQIFSKVIYLAKRDNCKVSPSQERTYEDVTAIIHKLGVPANIKGYNCLRSAVIYNLKHGNKSITKELYPAIAKELDTTPQRVERSIRHAITRMYKVGNDEAIIEIFGKKEHIPTNSEAISTISEYLRFNKI